MKNDIFGGFRHFLKKGSERGIALFMVLWVLALLTVIVSEFCVAMRTEVNMTRNFKEETQAFYIAGAGLNIAINELIRLQENPPAPSPDADSGNSGDEETVKWRINAQMPDIPFGEGRFNVHIDNESGKININRAGPEMLRMMLGRFDLDETAIATIVDAIQDWRDEDDLHRINGAEKDYYQSLAEPYLPKNGNFDSVEELLLVKGMTPEIFYGGLKQMLTVWPRLTPEKKVIDPVTNKVKKVKNDFNYNKININTASAQMLKMLPEITDDEIAAVLEFRREKDFTSLSELGQLVSAETFAAVSPWLSFRNSPLYTIRSTGMLSDTRTRAGIEALVETGPKFEKKYRILQQQNLSEYSVQDGGPA